MRPSPSAAFTAALNTAGVGVSRPDLKVELLNYQLAVSAWQQVGTTTGNTGRNHAIVTADGGVLQAYVDAGTPNASVYTRKVAAGSLLTAWGGWSAAHTTQAQTTAGVNLSQMSDRVRLWFQNSVDNILYYQDSFDQGVTWGAITTGVALGLQCYGMTGDYSPCLFVCYTSGANTFTVKTLIGGGLGPSWSAGNVYGMNPGGLTARHNQDGNYTVVAAVQNAPLSSFTSPSYTLQVTTYNTTFNTWGGVPYTALQTVDSPNGTITLSAPHLDYWATPGVSGAPGCFRLCFVRYDSGAYTGTGYTHLATCYSIDALHWTEALEEVLHPSTYGACWISTSVGTFLASSDTVLTCPPFDGSGATAAHYKDISADVLSVTRVHHDHQAGEVVVTLDNAAGQYAGSGTPALARGAVLRLSEGYVPPGGVQGAAGNVVYTGVYYVESWAYARTRDTSEVTITARDGRKGLDRQSRYPLTYTGQTVAWLIAELATRGGLLWVLQAAGAATAQFTQVLGVFTVPAGETWEQGLHRLGESMGFSFMVQVLNAGAAIAGGGAATAAQAGLEQFLYKEKVPGEGSVWSYQAEPEVYHLLQSDERANHVIVYGLTSPPVGSFPAVVVGAEAWDGANVAQTGQERYVHVTDKLLSTNTMAGIRAVLDLQYEQRAAVAGSLVVAHNPLLELWDVVTVTEVTVSPGGQNLRIAGLHYHYDALHAVNDLTLTLEGV